MLYDAIFVLYSHLATEGTWDDCMRVIGQCHSMLHANGVVRIQSDIRVGSRTDKHQTAADKVTAVEKLLAGHDSMATGQDDHIDV
jgi:hypothetical protein